MTTTSGAGTALQAHVLWLDYLVEASNPYSTLSSVGFLPAISLPFPLPFCFRFIMAVVDN